MTITAQKQCTIVTVAKTGELKKPVNSTSFPKNRLIPHLLQSNNRDIKQNTHPGKKRFFWVL